MMKARVHVDYLSHDWIAGDVVCAHSQIRKQMRSINLRLAQEPDNKSLRLDYQRVSRYQNALWRQMGKTCTARLGKHNALVHPSAVNWQKESDITWLYGPLYASDDQDEISNVQAQPHDGLKPVLKSSIYVRRRDDDRTPSFSSIASTSSSASSILPPSTPTNNGVRFSPESAKVQYFIPESPAREFLSQDQSYNPYWFYEDDLEDDDEDDDDDLWELMVGITSRVKHWLSPQVQKPSSSPSTGLFELIFTLISISKSVASLMATYVFYQGLVRMLWVVRRPPIRQRRTKDTIDYSSS